MPGAGAIDCTLPLQLSERESTYGYAREPPSTSVAGRTE